MLFLEQRFARAHMKTIVFWNSESFLEDKKIGWKKAVKKKAQGLN